MKIAIIIPTLNRHQILEKTISLLLREKNLISEILIIDQSEHVPSSFKAYCKTEGIIEYFHLDFANLPNARNFGLNKTKDDLVLFLDDDIIPSENLIKSHLENFADRKIIAVTGRVLSSSGENSSVGKSKITQTGQIISDWTGKERTVVNTIAGGNFSFRRRIIEKIGSFDINFIGNAMREESDFALRMVAAGYKIIFDPKAEIIHLAFRSGGSRQKSRIHWYFDLFHNEYYFFLKHFKRIYLPLFFLRKLRPILACAFYYGKGNPNAILTPFRAFKKARIDFDSLKTPKN